MIDGVYGRPDSPDESVKQRMYVAILKRHAFIIGTTYDGPAEWKHIESLLGTIRFR